MRCDWRHDPNAPRCRVIDLETGQQILYCAMADDETGEYERYDVDPGPPRVWRIAADGRVQTIKGRTRLRIEVLADSEDYWKKYWSAWERLEKEAVQQQE